MHQAFPITNSFDIHTSVVEIRLKRRTRALKPLARPTAPLAKSLKRDTTRVEPRFDAEITYLEITNDGMVRHPSFKRLVPCFALACAIAQAPTDQGFPSTSEKRSFFTMPIMSSPMSSAVLMFRNSASHASRPIISRLSGNSVVRSVPLY